MYIDNRNANYDDWEKCLNGYVVSRFQIIIKKGHYWNSAKFIVFSL